MWNKLKDAIFEADAETKPGTTTQAAVQGGAPTTPTAGATPAATASDAHQSQFYRALRSSVMSRITAYSSLMIASEKLAAIIPDPIQRLRAAQATSNDGRTVNQVADAVSIHLADIDGEALRFKATLEKKRSEIVGGLNHKKANAELTIASSTQELERLNARMKELHQAIQEAQTIAASVSTEIMAAENDLTTSLNDFTAAANLLREELNLGKNTILSSLT